MQRYKTFCLFLICCCCCCSITIMFNSLWLHEQAPLSSTISLSLLKFKYSELIVLSSCLILCHSLVLLPSDFPSIKVFSNESALCIMWPKYWSFNFNISPSNECSGLISFRINWFHLLVVQGTLESLLPTPQFKSIGIHHSAFFMVQLTSIWDYWENHSFD